MYQPIPSLSSPLSLSVGFHEGRQEPNSPPDLLSIRLIMVSNNAGSDVRMITINAIGVDPSWPSQLTCLISSGCAVVDLKDVLLLSPSADVSTAAPLSCTGVCGDGSSNWPTAPSRAMHRPIASCSKSKDKICELPNNSATPMLGASFGAAA